MASDTPSSYRSLVIYETYTRNHSPSGTFAGVEADLERLKDLGVDVVWFMPIHPIGKVERKGALGSSYAIANYREVNPEYGTKADFAHLIEKAHTLGLKVMIDVVFNHTSPELEPGGRASALVSPERFWQAGDHRTRMERRD